MTALREVYEAYHPTHVHLAPILCGVGMLSNAFLVFVLSRPKMRSPVNIMLSSIAVCDSLLMLSYLAYQIHFELREFPCLADRLSRASAHFTILHADLSILLRSSSLWLAAVMAAFRYHVMRRNPVVGRKTAENRRIAVILVGTVAAGVLISLTPIFLVHEIEAFPVDADGNCSGLAFRVNFSKLALERNGFGYRLALWSAGILNKLVPVTVLGIYILSLILELCKYGSYRSAFLPSLQPCYFLPGTLILTAILAVTFVLETPNAIVSTLVAITQSLDQGAALYRNLGDVFDIFSLITSVTTFPLYCGMSSLFRETLGELFRTRRNPESVRILQQTPRKFYDGEFRDENLAFNPDSPNIDLVDL